MEQKQNIKLFFWRIEPKTPEAISRWKREQKKFIAHQPNHKPNIYQRSVECETLKTDKSIGQWCCTFLPEGTYRCSGWTHRKTKTKVGWTRTLFRITVHNCEEQKYTIWDTGRLRHYWFRKPQRD